MAILLLVLAANPTHDAVVRDQVDLVEVNHFFDAFGNLTFDQVIWWELRGDEYRVIDWRILQGVRRSGDRRSHQIASFVGGHATPVYHRKSRRWLSRWYDEKSKVQRLVTAVGHRETWTQYDPELHDRASLPSGARRGLTRK